MRSEAEKSEKLKKWRSLRCFMLILISERKSLPILKCDCEGPGTLNANRRAGTTLELFYINSHFLYTSVHKRIAILVVV